jgi:hypothetical protein
MHDGVRGNAVVRRFSTHLSEDWMMQTDFRFRWIAPLLCALFLLPAVAHAQSNATLSGTVTDTQGAVVPGVTITAHNTATNQDRTVVTDVAGQYVAPHSRPARTR